MPTDTEYYVPKEQAEITRWFDRLELALINVPLDRENGPPAVGSADEFMFMCVGRSGEGHFKHHDSRNYVLVYPDGSLVIPKTDKHFLHGKF